MQNFFLEHIAMFPDVWHYIWNVLRFVLEFSLIAVLIYHVLYFLHGTRAVNVLLGVFFALIGLSFITDILKFEVMNWLLSHFWTILAISIVVVFQPEFRRALAQLGTHGLFQRMQVQSETINETVSAVVQMSRTKTGALIVFERQIGLASLKNSAVQLNAKVNSILLQSIFFPNSPLHDGALVIHGDRIEAGHVILPLTQQADFAEMHFGTRHRAAIGVTEESDALAVIVSEETGYISVALKGKLIQNMMPLELSALLNRELIDNNRTAFFSKEQTAEDRT